MTIIKKIAACFSVMALWLYQKVFVFSMQCVYGPPNAMGQSGSSVVSTSLDIMSILGNILFALCLPIILMIGLVLYFKESKERKKVFVIVLSAAFGISCLAAVIYVVGIIFFLL